ncbi:M1 family metallopeptidase [Capnocytophaga cynodegmi]|uniref:M1 family metallopeptidase n=1 Tax=Capnocytophaga cynodegmi TaxID=28189 RepID=UPI00037E1943|nr:M1 family metallopeptidase [Capnocytophaga cynodegmi]CEN38305.1 Leukotriene A(4) hydrolase [Capnocytophaga cynodegmi]
MNKYIFAVFLLGVFTFSKAQNTSYWQQQANYEMEIDMDVKNFQYKGKQKLTYTNNSSDTLQVVFYHLYLNAFQPGSEMDARLQSITDPDRRMVVNKGTKENPIYESRIASLKPNEIGYIHVKSLTQNGESVSHKTEGTILKVNLKNPILPNSKVIFDMEFEAQVPVMIRRTGRNSRDGVALSMAQWYPKIAAYDYRGWHPTEYIVREFYGVWGNFDVKITIDKNYILGGSGVLQNNNEIGFGYENEGVKVPKAKGKTKTWHFVAKNVHDFTWAADMEFKHDKVALKDGKVFHFLYKKYDENWRKMQPELVKVFDFFNEIVGKYPWEQYSFIQGGDGGMEYAMCTLVAGGEKYESVLGTSIHELAHAWFQHLLATDESSYAWMDEGFTSFIEDLAMHSIISPDSKGNPFQNSYTSYYELVKSGLEEPATTHADRFDKNFSYSVMAYSKGLLFLTQLGYIMGEQNVIKSLQKFYKDFAFKNPTPNDFIRVAEKVSGMQLQWFLNEFIGTTHTADYAIESVKPKGDKTEITLRRIGRLPLPVDLFVIEKSKKIHYYHIPLRMTFGNKENPYKSYQQHILSSWGWANLTYTFEVDLPMQELESIIIDPFNISVDINKENNVFNN